MPPSRARSTSDRAAPAAARPPPRRPRPAANRGGEAWNSEEPRRAWPARTPPAPFLEWWNDDHGRAESSLQLAQIGEQRRYLAAGVLVDAMQAHEGIEHEQTRRELGDRLVEAFVFYSVCATEPCSLGGCEAISFLVFLARFLASAAAAISSMVLTTAGIGLPKRLT